MRLTKNIITAITKSVVYVYGDQVKVYLFGSRTDNLMKGGDIDLLIKTEEHKMTASNKVLFLVHVKKQLGERKIDVVYFKDSVKQDLFFKTISQKSLQIC
jgi:predicted nucleotidyltransferase